MIKSLLWKKLHLIICEMVKLWKKTWFRLSKDIIQKCFCQVNNLIEVNNLFCPAKYGDNGVKIDILIYRSLDLYCVTLKTEKCLESSGISCNIHLNQTDLHIPLCSKGDVTLCDRLLIHFLILKVTSACLEFWPSTKFRTLPLS